MKSRYFYIISLSFIWACSQAPGTPPVISPALEPQQPIEMVEETVVIPTPRPEETPLPLETGGVYAKTVFEGVVKTSYVTLTICQVDDPLQSYQLIIGDKERQKDFPWDVQTVGPGYFFIELPAGEYRFSTITIPVGQKKASEPMDVVFRVKAGKTVYLGTLQIIGTKEKVKLGGVPVIKPGFEYSVKILDETLEAQEKFSRRFPDEEASIVVDLMQVHMATNATVPIDASPSGGQNK